MEYLLLICDVETEQLKPGDSGFEELMGEYQAFSAECEKRGVIRGAQRLMPTSAASTVRVRDGKTIVTDGPFAETKEQFGGFFHVNCKDLDEALELAAKIPTSRVGSIEVRPVM